MTATTLGEAPRTGGDTGLQLSGISPWRISQLLWLSTTLRAKVLYTVLRQVHCHLPTMPGTGEHSHFNAGMRHGSDLGVLDFVEYS